MLRERGVFRCDENDSGICRRESSVCATELGSDVTIGDDWLHGKTDLEGVVVDSVATDGTETGLVGDVQTILRAPGNGATAWTREE